LVEYEKEKEKLAILPEKWEPRVVEKSGLEAEIEADVCKDILTVPKDDVEIRKIKREFRTENMPAKLKWKCRDQYGIYTISSHQTGSKCKRRLSGRCKKNLVLHPRTTCSYMQTSTS